MLHRSMRGSMIDMTSLTKTNGESLAVTGGGMKMNARGDILGPGGKIVKKIEQIQEEYNKFAQSNTRQKISMADGQKMKKFAIKRQFLTPEEVQKQMMEIEKEKAKAKKLAEKVLATTEMMSSSEPIITDNTDIEINERTKSKPKRTIVDSEE